MSLTVGVPKSSFIAQVKKDYNDRPVQTVVSGILIPSLSPYSIFPGVLFSLEESLNTDSTFSEAFDNHIKKWEEKGTALKNDTLEVTKDAAKGPVPIWGQALSWPIGPIVNIFAD